MLTHHELLHRMLVIRLFEERIDALFAAGELKGTSHLAAGQEATAIGAGDALRPDDYVTSNHRGHGHFIGRGGDPRRIMAELFGKETGYSRGRGGTQHMADFSLGFLGMNGITGGMMPIAAGAAFSAKYRNTGQVALSFFGDGASNQGTFHETLNMASVWKLPVIFFCENNNYAMSTPASCTVGVANIADRAAGYCMPGVIVDGNDVLAVRDTVAEAAVRARAGEGPTLIEAKTYRTLGHSRGDQRVYRTREEEAEWAAMDPISLFSKYLIANGTLTEEGFIAMHAQATAVVDEAERFARESPLPVAV